MTRDEIIRMAREAGSIDSEDVIETMYAAFTAAEREACARIADAGGHDIYIATAIRAKGEKE